MPGGVLRARAATGWLPRLGLIVFVAVAAAIARAEPLSVDVAAPDAEHVAWRSAQQLQAGARRHGLALAPHRATAPAGGGRSLSVVPLPGLARELPELDLLLLPYFYPDLAAVHRAWDGTLGNALRAAAREHGWELLALWDEGMHILSGNLAYTHPRTLSGAEFVILRDDPVAEKELRALDAWTRSARPASLPQLHKECVVSSRSATAQQLAREQLSRVHLDLTLSRHRYEGWVVAMPLAAWRDLEPRQRQALGTALSGMRSEQRRIAASEDARALEALRRDGMTAHALDGATWRAYRALQPPWESFLSERLAPESRRRLLGLAAASAGLDRHGGGKPAAAQPQPRTP